MDLTTLHTKINYLPDEFKIEVNDFIDFLLEKKMKQALKKNKAKFGCLKGQIHISTDFDEPLEDFADYM